MPKKKRTRKQKMVGDLRQTTNQQPLPTEQMQTYSVEKKAIVAPKIVAPAHSAKTIATSEYRYLSKDLLKTVLLTCSIIVIELVLQRLTNGV